MRIVLLILLILINTFSLPLQAMGQHAMLANMPCDMQEMSSMQHTNPQTNGCLAPSDPIIESANLDCCDKTPCNDCTSISVISFINNHKLFVDTYKQNNSLRYELTPPLQQYQDSLYRPPLIS